MESTTKKKRFTCEGRILSGNDFPVVIIWDKEMNKFVQIPCSHLVPHGETSSFKEKILKEKEKFDQKVGVVSIVEGNNSNLIATGLLSLVSNPTLNFPTERQGRTTGINYDAAQINVHWDGSELSFQDENKKILMSWNARKPVLLENFFKSLFNAESQMCLSKFKNWNPKNEKNVLEMFSKVQKELTGGMIVNNWAQIRDAVKDFAPKAAKPTPPPPMATNVASLPPTPGPMVAPPPAVTNQQMVPPPPPPSVPAPPSVSTEDVFTTKPAGWSKNRWKQYKREHEGVEFAN